MYTIEENHSTTAVPSTPPPAYERDPPILASNPVIESTSLIPSTPLHFSKGSIPPPESNYLRKSVPATFRPWTRVAYDQKLALLGIDKQTWSAFTLELQRAASPHLSLEVMMITGGFVLESALPYLSTWGAWAIRQKMVWNKVKKHVNEELPEGKDKIAMVFENWNNRWAHLGLETGIELIKGKDAQNAAANEVLRLKMENRCNDSPPNYDKRTGSCNLSLDTKQHRNNKQCCYLFNKPTFRIFVERKPRTLTECR